MAAFGQRFTSLVSNPVNMLVLIHLTKGISVLLIVAKQVGVALLMKWEQVGSSDWLGGSRAP